MRVLLDECVDRRLAQKLIGFTVSTVPEMGWAGVKNGELLALAEKQFDLFLTVDSNLSFQQHLPRFNIAVVVVRASTNRIADLALLVPRMLDVLPNARRGEVTRIGT
ncbi:MAG: DUF5615 family PIN-like protein [Betaproteobacteria bacterium]|nr:DUF5615 family PIN-like protein [Betaproteobacteria bacterium]